MVDTRIKINKVVANQLPGFVKEEFPLVGEFLSQYYLSLEGQGSTLDILQNIDQYVKVDSLANLNDSTTLESNIDFIDDTIVVNSTYGFPQSYGLIEIDSEIITYTGITTNSFTGCIRGFSGITSYRGSNTPDELVFSQSGISTHSSGSTVNNLSVLFLKEFFKKVKVQVTPGFEDRELHSGVNQNLFVKQSKDFYSTKGTDQSFEILFRALYGEDVEVIKPRDYLFIPSYAEYRVSRDLVVEALEGNPEDLVNRTLFQDETDIFPGASGSINDVQRIVRGNKDYYVISLDYDFDKDITVDGSIFGRFSVHPKTKLITSVSAGSTTLDVDSTVGFPTTGKLIVDYSDGTSSVITYESKTLNQFFGCSGVDRSIDSTQDLRVDAYAYGYSGLSTDNVVKVRVTGVLSELDLFPNTFYYESGDVIQTKTLGIGLTSSVSNNWFYNIATSYEVQSITLQNISNFTYIVKTYDKHNFVIGDSAKIIFTDGTEKTTNVISILNQNTFVIRGQGQLDLQRNYVIQKILSRVNSNNYPELNIYTTNVQNLYADGESLYVASPSIPNYLDQPLNINNRSVTLSGTFSGEEIFITNHGFYTGDSVTYRPVSSTNTLNISEGIYFVKVIDQNTIKLSRSRSNIYNGNYISVSGTVSNNLLEYTPFAYQKLEPQKLIRKISDPINDENDHETIPGLTGILVNGVEILNYKSSDSVYYGSIKEIDVTSGGSNYDVINPPVLEVSDISGSGVSAYCEIEGKLERIEIIDGGFDYVETPIITITGGNGTEAVAKPNLITVNHSVSFNSIESAGLVNLTNNTVAFSTYHKFRDGELVIYETNGQTSVGGLSTDSPYYVSVQDSFTVKFHRTFLDAISEVNVINLTSYGVGNHIVKSANPKKILGSISIENSGSGYKNRKVTVSSSGINTSSNTITVRNHRYRSGELVYYTPGTSPIEGLSQGSYYLTKINDDNFKLSQVGVGSTASDFYYRNSQYIDLKSTGSGIQSFNYPEIQVTVSGVIGVSTRTDQDFNAVVQPIFRGEITSVFVEDGGVGYGSSEILNYNRQPTFTLNSGSGAQLQAIISNGRIIEVLVLNSGSGYNSPPTLTVEGSGSGAILTPLIVSGTITGVKVVAGGSGYSPANTSVTVTSSGSNAQFSSTPKIWTVNIFERLLQNNQITDDDGVITKGTNQSFGLQYSHLYSPRKLRQSVLGTKIVDGNTVYTPDLTLENGREILSDTHSPIIGWAYDGNPIYGPYGYSSLSGGSVRLMKSGYDLSVPTDRPNPVDSFGNSIYPDGFFVNDFSYKNSGDLDEFNGRFCVTPEFPNGIYAYFTSIDTESLESSPPFKNYRKPVFPYFIGNKFKSKPINYNFDRYSNQNDIDLNSTNYLRNTTPYNLLDQNSYYDFAIDQNKIQIQNTVIASTTSGKVESVGIVTGGSNYQVGDQLLFDNSETEGIGADAIVSLISGEEILDISIASTSISNVEFIPINLNEYFVGFSTSPHNLKNYDIISVSGLSTTGTNLQSLFVAEVFNDSFTLKNNVSDSSTTGIITYFNVNGRLSYPTIRENDVLEIGSEKIKVLNVDPESSRIRVLREYEGTVGSSHTASSLLIEDPRKFYFSSGLINTPFQYNVTKQFYFDPSETIGIGTTSGVGIGYTLSFSNPGVGITQIFIPTKSLYIPGHNLNTGDELIYNTNGGGSIAISTDGVTNFSLVNSQVVYVAKISNDLIGISTSKVGLGTNGSFVGINSSLHVNTLYFTGIGTGNNHSFKTNPENILRGIVNKNYATVSTASTHGLNLYDNVFMEVLPGITTTVFVQYNDYHRKLIVNPRSFLSGDVNISNNTITIQNHGLVTGQKVLHTSTLPSGGLESNKIYYVYVIGNNQFKLCSTISDALKLNPIVIDITSASSGTISKINPPLAIERNNTVVFDLSHSSLSFSNNSVLYSAFDFNIYSDTNYKNEFYSSSSNNIFEVTKSGIIGISTNARLTLKVTDFLPKTLYYNLKPVNLDLNSDVKKQISVDNENIKDNNTLVVVDNILNKKHLVTGIGSTTFTFNLTESPSESLYTKNNGILKYSTNSNSAYGAISNINVNSGGRGYRRLPGISSVSSIYGNGAILIPESSSIGKILKTNIQDIGFDYSSDKTLRPQTQIPQILRVEPFYSFERIGIASVGVNYLTAPNLIVLDGKSNQIITDVDLRYDLGDTEVSILKNTELLNNTTPVIIPINNSNGIPVSSVSFNNSTKDVTVSLGVSFSSLNDFPFEIGDSILVENISVGIATTARGYNSSNYNYSFFTLTQRNPNIGGSNATITYNLSNYLQDGEIAGSYDPVNSVGRVIPTKHFPVFDVSIVANNFLKNEKVTSNSASGIVNSWDNRNGYLKISSIKSFNIGETIIGSTSNTNAKIVYIFNVNSNYSTDSSSIVKKGWLNETGFLNNNLQRLHDNDYYQYLSYSLKSKVQYEDWNNAVSSLNHAAGFKKFGDLIVESRDLNNIGISTEQDLGDFIGISDFISTIDLNCVNDFDLVRERTLNINSDIYSDEIVFKSRTIQDYIESIGNRVLVIDDISQQFNSNPRPEQFSSIDLFTLDSARSKKYIIYTIDKRFTRERQITLVTLLHNNSVGFLNQYGRVETVLDLGSFDFNIVGEEGQLFFYPTKYAINDYNLSHVAYNIEDTIVGIGSTNFGDTVRVSSSSTTLPSGTSSSITIVGIASTYRSSKLLVQYGAVDGSYYEYDELTVIHDGTNVELLEYGQLNTNTLLPTSSAGLGTYNAYLSGSNLNIDLIPNVGLGVTYNVNTIRISIANTSSTGVSTSTLNTAILDSRITSIASSTSPVANIISEYSSDYSCAYYVISIEDTTNNQYQISEVIVADDGAIPSLTEFGVVQTGSNLGSFDCFISGGKTKLTFTPISNANVQVRVFQNALRLVNTDDPNILIDLNNTSINSGYGDYTATEIDIKRSFDLTHKQLPIFERNFVGSASTIVDLTNNLIKIPNHYFVTGEELIYSYDKTGTTQAIGIGTTTIAGIGTTDKLPSTVYAIKVNDISIRLASSVENALKVVPVPIVLSSVGIGTLHTFTSKKQNSRVLVSIDNVIQSPIVSTSVTTALSQKSLITDDTIVVSGITSFFGGDLIKIDDEIMRINAVGFGSTNTLLVQRPWMGTEISSHSNGALVTKIKGDYNIVNNKINFITAPYGPTPIGTTTNSPDKIDYTGITTHSTFSGRSFMRSGVPNTVNEPYYNNYVLDDISSQFTGYSTSFTLKSGGINVTGFSTDNAIILVNQIFQAPKNTLGGGNAVGDYDLLENVGITSIQFTGSISSTSYDINTANVPLGGIIVSVGSTKGFGYQPLVSAAGTAVVSGLGTISSISIGNSGSGYRSGIQTLVNVGVITSSTGTPNIEFIGTAAISSGHIVSVAITNPGTGYTSSNPPIVVFDAPLSYSDIPLVYSSSSTAGLGTGAKVNVIVGQGSSIIDFEITNLGYGYGQGEILTIGVGGTVGIPTNTALTYKEFQITINRTYSDSFAGWSLGNLLVIDPLDSLFDGIKVSFPIKVNGNQKTIRAKTGSPIDIDATLLVFINDILQVPGKGYIFNGGSFITFTEPPKVGDTSKILFYQGTSFVDVLDVDILETIKVGDEVRLNDDNITFKEDERVVFGINSSDNIDTNVYPGPGISLNENYERPIIWCRQTEDKFINGYPVSKDRILYEPLIYPNTRIIQSVGTGSTVIFVESVKTFFDSLKENFSEQNAIKIISQDNLVGASATAIVSIAGTISAISVTNGGIGYTFAPSVSIANPVGLGITQRSEATSLITSGIVTSITVTSSGTGYTTSNPPVVLIEEPDVSYFIEEISPVQYSGDFGIISGISTTSVGVASTGIVFDLVIPSDSFLRDASIVGSAITVSGIQTGYYFVVYNTNIGSGVTSLRQDGSIVSIGSSFLDNIYEVTAVSIAQTSVIGFGVTYVAKVTVSVRNYNGLVGTGYSNFFGEYSWGRISTPTRVNGKSFNAYNNGILGISTSPIVERFNPLRYLNYN
jgi:hypothetical protein